MRLAGPASCFAGLNALLLMLRSKAATALWKDVCQAYEDKDLKALGKATTELLQLLEDLDELLATHE